MVGGIEVLEDLRYENDISSGVLHCNDRNRRGNPICKEGAAKTLRDCKKMLVMSDDYFTYSSCRAST